MYCLKFIYWHELLHFFAVALSIMLSNTFDIQNLFDFESFNYNFLSLAVTVTAFVMHIRYDINPILLTLLAGVIGWIVYYI